MSPQDTLLTSTVPGIDPLTILPPEQCNQLQIHAREAFPNECIGYVKDRMYHRLDNVSPTPDREAAIPKEVMAQLLSDEIDMLCHSHPNGPHCPSESDMALQMQMDIPHAIVSTDGNAATPVLFYGRMLERHAMVGRPFVHGVMDCFAEGLDFYSVVMGIELEDFPRDWEWWRTAKEEETGGLYLKHFAQWGFRESEGGLEVGDVFLLRAASKVPNHCGIYIGDHLMLHHLAGRAEFDHTRLGVIEPMVRWLPHGRIEKVLRYGA